MLKQLSRGTHRRLFIRDINQETCENTAVVKWMRVAVLGVVTAVKAFPERIVYTIDDGTGALDCSIKIKDPDNVPHIALLKKRLNSESVYISGRKNVLQSMLSRLEKGDDTFYERGNALIAFGYICVVHGQPRLDVQWHNKILDPNMEHLWMMQQLSLYHHIYQMS